MSTTSEAAAASRRFATFRIAEMFCGIEVGQVQEVLKFQEMTPVPTVSEVIRGLINLRGQIVTAVDLRRRFRLPARAAGEKPMNVVLRSEGGAVSLLVDEIGDVVEVMGLSPEDPPSTMDSFHRELVKEIFQLEGTLLLALDTEKVLQLEDLGNS